jgi:hypothetical protein
VIYLKVIYCEVGSSPRVITVKDNLLAFQKLVGGYIEMIRLTDGIVLICNEDGKSLGLKPNYGMIRGNKVDIVVGNFIVCRADKVGNLSDILKGDWVYLTKESLILRKVGW